MALPKCRRVQGLRAKFLLKLCELLQMQYKIKVPFKHLLKEVSAAHFAAEDSLFLVWKRSPSSILLN